MDCYVALVSVLELGPRFDISHPADLVWDLVLTFYCSDWYLLLCVPGVFRRSVICFSFSRTILQTLHVPHCSRRGVLAPHGQSSLRYSMWLLCLLTEWCIREEMTATYPVSPLEAFREYQEVHTWTATKHRSGNPDLLWGCWTHILSLVKLYRRQNRAPRKFPVHSRNFHRISVKWHIVYWPKFSPNVLFCYGCLQYSCGA